MSRREDIYIPTEEEIKNQSALIGAFIINFEQVCAFIRFIILKICYPNYTKLENNNIEILLEGLTSEPLRKKLEALVYDNYQEEEELIRLSNLVSKKFSQLIPIRNSIAHGSMLMGYAGYDGELSSDTFLLKHSKSTKQGINRNSMIIKNSSLKFLITQTRFIDNAYSELCALIDKEIRPENKDLHLKQFRLKVEKIEAIKLDYEKIVTK